MLWPDHCVEGTEAQLSTPVLSCARTAELILRKGFHKTIDSYSAFRENDRLTRTGLPAISGSAA